MKSWMQFPVVVVSVLYVMALVTQFEKWIKGDPEANMLYLMVLAAPLGAWLVYATIQRRRDVNGDGQ